MIKIHTPDYQPTEVNTGQGLAESNAFSLFDDPTTIPTAKWTLESKYRAHLLELSELARQARQTPQKSTGISTTTTDAQLKGERTAATAE